MELCTEETPVKGTEDSVQNGTAERLIEQNKRNEGGTRSKKKNILCESFPWYEEFKEMCSCPDYTTSIKGLVRLVRVYIGYISRDVASCQNKPSRACKIKQNLSRVLVFFNMRYKKLDPIFDESDYMDLMSQLLTMYLDIGVKASRRGKESARIIAKKTTSILFVILNNSPDHIIDTLLKAEHLYKPRFKELFIPTFMKVIHLPPTTGLTYIRFLFIYKIWKHLSQDNDDRCRLNKLAVASLKPSSRLVDLIERGKFFNILPNLLPTNDYSSPSKLTRFYMTTKFDLKSSVKEFLKLTQWMKVYHLRPNLEALENYKEENLQPNLSVISVDDDKSTEDENWIPDHPSSFNDPFANIPGNEFVPRPLRPSNFDYTMNVISIDLTQNPNKNSSENQENESKDLSNNVLPDTIDNQNKKLPKKINKKKKSKKSSQGSFQHDTEQFLKKLSLDDFQRNVEEPSSLLSNNTQVSKENGVSQKTLLPNTQTQESNNNIPTPADDNYIAINKDTNVKPSDAEHRRTNCTSVEKSSKRLECSKARKGGVTISEKRVVGRALVEHKNDSNKVQNKLASENINSKYNDCINNLENTSNSISLVKNYEKRIAEDDYDLNQNENYNPIKESNSPVDHHINSDMECMGPSRVSVVDTSKLLESNWLQHCVNKIKQESHSLSDQPLSEINFLSHDTFGKVNCSDKPSEVFSSNANLVNVPECSISNTTEYESEESNLVIDEDVDCLREGTKAIDQNSRKVQESSAAVISNIAMEVDQPDQNILEQSARSTDTNLRIVSEKKVTEENQINIDSTLSQNNLSRPTEEKQQKQSGHDKTLSVSEIQIQSKITRDNVIQRNEGNDQLSQTTTTVVADIYVGTAVQHNNVVTQESASFDLDNVRFNKTDSNMNQILEKNSPDEHLISNVCSSQSSQNYLKPVQNNQLVNKRSTISYDDVIPITGPPQPPSQSPCASSVAYHEFNVPYVPYTVNNIVDAMCAYEFDLAVAQEVEVCSVQDGGAGELLDTVGVDNAPPARTLTPAESYVTAQSNNHKYELQQVSIDTPSGTFIENRGMHKRTVENDISMCGSQREFKQFYLYQKVAPTIPVPLPIQDMPENCARCLCDVCLKNHKTLMFNYSVLRYMQDSKLKDSGKGSSPVNTIDKDLSNDYDCNLPLKKRRTMTKTAPKEPELYSYPNIPMMSIAQLQLSNTMPSNKLADWNNSRKTCSEDPINLVQSKQSTTQKQTKQTKRKATKRRKSSRKKWYLILVPEP